MFKRFTGLMLASLIMVAGCSSALTQMEGESNRDFKARVHRGEVQDVQMLYNIVDLGMLVAKAKGFGDDQFWKDYDVANEMFLITFKSWADGEGGDLSARDVVDIALNTLRQYVAKLQKDEKYFVGPPGTPE